MRASVTLDETIAERFAAIVGPRYALRDGKEIEPYITDARSRYETTSPLVLRPGSVEEVSAILKLATETKTPVVPQGGNTGLVGGGIPLVGQANAVMISLGRMNRIVDVDAASNTMLVEAGAILETIQKAADDADRLFPLSLGSQGSCQIGGNIGSNAGGTGVLAYGNTRDLVMGLEVVLPTGEVLNGLSRLRKDNTGYDLRNLFVGAEGTLGIVTKAVLKLFPKPAGTAVAYVGVKTPDNALDLLNRAKGAAGSGLTGFEFISETAMDFTIRHAANPTQPPLADPHPWTILIEVSSGRSEAEANEILESILGDALESVVIDDAVVAQSLAQQKAFWQLREDMSWAQKPEGASIKHDISVPVGSVPAFIEKADAAVLAIVPEARIVNFGHMGDGNLHYNISQPVGWDPHDFFAHEDAIHNAIYKIVGTFEGSISAEHGIGQMKRDKLAVIKDPVSLALMKRIKREIDPAGIMNPGKVLQT
ncbi:FAD-binding oxidoreductase [Pseudahrensia aquimaris]|uniref:FAD-binding oxidoreductase n=1 Tax=Pseudahrensia aquimaris TaxID=744461 RepID=A0ABW3FC01_9HYPH